ncbi:MAG: transglycosylase domain-containing protein [Anaerolineaceae bacterium]|nr:transglycosylase domain-containing protein [Anaerolineaceae bacterium]
MADQKQSQPEKSDFSGGWHTPQSPGGWHTPDTSGQGAWREPVRVRTLPEELEVEPEAEGAWHLPKPEDTVFTPDHETEIPVEAPPQPEPEMKPEDILSQQEVVPPAVLETFDDEDDDSAFSMSELVALASLVEQTPPPDILPGSAAPAVTATTTPQEESPATTGLSPAERALMQAAGGRTEPLSDLPLMEPAEKAASQPLERITSEEPEASTGQVGTVSGEPADYARRQLERLSNGEPTGATGQGTAPTPATPATAAASDPQAYAREQLARIQGGQPAAQPAVQPVAQPAAPVLTQQQQELLQKYQTTERQVSALRQQYRAGQLTREQFEEQLRGLLVLGENNVWWMMGAENDVWFRYDNQQAAWVEDTPQILALAGTAATSATGPQPVSDASLAYFSSEPVQSQEYTQPSQATPSQPDVFGQAIGGEMPLPKQVPVQDLDQTMVNPNAPYMAEYRQSEAPTQQNYNIAYPEETRLHDLMQAGPADDAIPTAHSAYDAAPNYAQALGQAAPHVEQVQEEERQRAIGTTLRFVAIGGALLALLVACGVVFLLVQYSNIANEYQPQIAALAAYQPAFQSVLIYDADDQLIATINSTEGGARTNVALKDISPFMVDAVLALENERFFEDPGWDQIAIARAFIQNLSSGQIESGASTITQQLARQLVLGNYDVTAQRKIQEIVIAAEISKQYEKADILELYLNEIYFGNQAYGVEAAAQFYFGHGADSLNLYESAFLTGIIQSPATYNPVIQPGESREAYGARRDEIFKRMDEVLKRMQEVGCMEFPGTGISVPPGGFCVTREIVEQNILQRTAIERREFTPITVNFRYPHFVQFVRDQVDRHYGENAMFRQGFKIYTTLESGIQDEAIRDLQLAVAQYGSAGVNTGAIMVTDPATGAILAMVGGPDFNNADIAGQVNNALTWQQPGSAIKPMVYAAALEGRDTNLDGVIDQYLTPASILWDVPTTFTNTVPAYTPTDFDGVYRGPLSVRAALQNSINVAAVKAYAFIGADQFRALSERVGLQFLDGADFGLPTAIGATEVTLYNMMTAYGTLSANGTRHDLFAIRRITDSGGADAGWIGQPEAVPNAISPQLAYLMQNILSDDSARATVFGLNGPMTIPGFPTSNFVATKTGTSNDARDLWTMGFTKNAVVGVWLGRHDNQPTRVTAASVAAAPIWQRVMQFTLSTMNNLTRFQEVTGLSHYDICADTGTLPPANCAGLRNEVFIAAQPPAGADQAFVVQAQIDSWTGLLANDQCKRNVINQTFVNITDQAALDWLKGAGLATAQRLGITDPTHIQILPTASCDTSTEIPIADFNYPSGGETLQGIVNVTGSASATTTFSRYQLVATSAATGQTYQIAGPITTPVTGGNLGSWDTRNVPNGTYVLELQMFANNTYAGYLTRQVTINVNNPTPTTVVIPTNPPQLFPSVTPLPFDQPTAPPTIAPGG